MRISPRFLSLSKKRTLALTVLAGSLTLAGAVILSSTSKPVPNSNTLTAETNSLPSAKSPIILSQTPATVEQSTIIASTATIPNSVDSPQQQTSPLTTESQTTNNQVDSLAKIPYPFFTTAEVNSPAEDNKTTELKAALGEDKYRELIEIPREILARQKEEGFQVAMEEDLTGSLDDTAEYLKIDTEWSEVRPDSTSKAPTSDNSQIATRALSGPVVSPAQQPSGSLDDIIVYTNPGHGFVAISSWTTQRGITNGMVEDFGNLDQFTWFTQYMFNAGATVVPFRPIGFQDNEVVLDNDDTSVTWTGTWNDSTSTIFYGSAGDTPYRWADVSNVSETAVAKYTPTIPEDGIYPVYCWTRHGSDRIHQTYRVVYAGGSTEVKVNHKRVGLGWVWLGSYYFEAGTSGYVEIPNYHDTETGVVIADTIRFGNGMGDIDRGFGVSGQPRWMESNRYWIQNAVSQGMSTDIYDGTGDDGSDTVGAPPKMAVSMNRETDGSFYDRIIFSIHSNAYDGSIRGAMGLAADGNDPVDQYVIAQMANDEIELDLEALDSGVAFPYDSVDSSGDVYDGVDYGEISDRYLNGEMTGTIIETAFHDNIDDAYMMQDPRCRNAMGRACYQSIVKFLNQHGDNNVPSDLLPEPPTDVYAVNNGNGTVTVGWTPPVSDGIGGDAATGYIVSRSTNGLGFGSPVTVSGGTSTSTSISGLTAGQTYYFQIAATNAGGTSLPADTMAVRVLASATADVLIVNGFDRYDRFLSPNVYFSNNLNGYARLVRPQQINSFDYVIQHAKAIANYGQSFDSANMDAVAGGDVSLSSYDAVVWIGGAQGEVDASGAQPEFTAFTSTLQTQIQSYLNGGGNLFVSGSEIAWDLDADTDQTDANSVFLQSVLKTDYVDDDVYTGLTTPPNTAIGATGSIFDGVSLSFDNGDDGIYNVDYPDVINAINGSNVVMTYTGSSEGTVNAAVQFAGVDYKVIFMGFPFETILDETDRNSVMSSALTFLLDTTPITPSPTPDGTPTPSPTPSPTPTVSPTPDPNAGPVEDFESYTAGTSVMFQDPGWSGSTSGINTATDLVSVSELFANDILDPTINSTGTKSERLFWTWTSPGSGFVRATTYNTTYRPNPIIDLTQGVSVYIRCVEGEIDVALWIRETGVSGTIGNDGGTSGSIEEITTKQRVTASSDWQYLYFDLPNESYTAVTGDGTLDGSWGTLEALAISAVSTSSVANVDIYVDDFYNGSQHTPIGAATPTPSPTPTVSPTASPSPTASATPTASPTPTPSPTASPTPTATPAVYIHVDSIVLSTSGNRNVKGVATVTVVDASDNPMTGVTVSGTFSGDYSESGSGVTDSSGSTTITTASRTRSPSFTFCVTNLSDGSSTYDSSANVETCDTGSF